MTQEDRDWQAVIRRDTSSDGRFVYAVTTTRVYCRPGCSSRTPLRRNVRFYATPEAARDAGYRPCLKCRPDQPHATTAIAAVVHDLCRYIEDHSAAPLTLPVLAKQSGYSAAYLQRRFSAIVGSSPKAYQTAIRARRLKCRLRRNERLDDAMYGAGYGSPSRVYEKLTTQFGMTPTQYRDGGRGLQISYAASKTRLGWMMIGATARGVCFLQFAHTKAALINALKAEFPTATLRPMQHAQQPDFAAWMRALDAYLAGRAKTLEMPLDLRGTAFQVLVWRYLHTIPAGSVRSYGAVAAAIGTPAAVRAVASACARNRIAIAVPCHRVIRGNGDLADYRWSLTRKRALLELERTPPGSRATGRAAWPCRSAR